MRAEKEIVWLAKIYKSKAIRDPANLRFITTPLCKKDFEVLLDAPENSKEFHEWFDNLVMNKVLFFTDKIRRGNRNNVLLNGYTGNISDIMRYIRENPELELVYDALDAFFKKDKIM